MTTSTTNYSFPTLGQVIRFAFDACGVLPRMRSESDEMTEQDKKRIQRQLQRLANEEGKLRTAGRRLRTSARSSPPRSPTKKR